MRGSNKRKRTKRKRRNERYGVQEKKERGII
jgi:hypothetical protein